MAFKVLDNLLNDASLLAAHTTMEIEYIPREMIIKNERNHYSIKNVADFKLLEEKCKKYKTDNN